MLIDLARAVTVFGQSHRRGGGPRIVTARAGPASVVMLISDRALERISGGEPDLWRAVSALVYGQLDATVHMLAQLLSLPPRERIVMRLRTLASDGLVRANQSDLAELTGLSRKVVNTHLAALERAGRIRRGYAAITLL